jgi:hypothetical protein
MAGAPLAISLAASARWVMRVRNRVPDHAKGCRRRFGIGLLLLATLTLMAAAVIFSGA